MGVVYLLMLAVPLALMIVSVIRAWLNREAAIDEKRGVAAAAIAALATTPVGERHPAPRRPAVRRPIAPG